VFGCSHGVSGGIRSSHSPRRGKLAAEKDPAPRVVRHIPALAPSPVRSLARHIDGASPESPVRSINRAAAAAPVPNVFAGSVLQRASSSSLAEPSLLTSAAIEQRIEALARRTFSLSSRLQEETSEAVAAGSGGGFAALAAGLLPPAPQVRKAVDDGSCPPGNL